MTAKVQLRLCGTMDHLRIAWQTGETLLESIPFEEDPEGTRYNFLLAMQEMVTNVLRHGYDGAESLPIEIEYGASEGGMSVVIRDRGPEFDPVGTDSISVSEEFPESEGGYGIMIAKMVMDELDYTREDGWNVLRMFKATRSAGVLASQ